MPLSLCDAGKRPRIPTPQNPGQTTSSPDDLVRESSPRLHLAPVAGFDEITDVSPERFLDKAYVADFDSLGFALACNQATPPNSWLVVRGISNAADRDKSDESHWARVGSG
jgi:hypothetical protein